MTKKKEVYQDNGEVRDQIDKLLEQIHKIKTESAGIDVSKSEKKEAEGEMYILWKEIKELDYEYYRSTYLTEKR